MTPSDQPPPSSHDPKPHLLRRRLVPLWGVGAIALVALLIGTTSESETGTTASSNAVPTSVVTVTAPAVTMPAAAVPARTVTVRVTKTRTKTARAAAPAFQASSTDPRFSYCYEANAAGYGPYFSGIDTEYDWYRDADNDGSVCE